MIKTVSPQYGQVTSISQFIVLGVAGIRVGQCQFLDGSSAWGHVFSGPFFMCESQCGPHFFWHGSVVAHPLGHVMDIIAALEERGDPVTYTI